MRKVLLAALLVTLLQAEPTYFQPEGWSLGTEFPVPPELSEKRTRTKSGEVVELRAHVEINDDIYAVERVLYPISLPADKRDAAYEGGKRGLLRAVPGTLVSEKTIAIAGHEGRRYVVNRHEQTRTMDVRVVIVGNEVYQFIYDRFTKHSPSSASVRFFGEISETKK